MIRHKNRRRYNASDKNRSRIERVKLENQNVCCNEDLSSRDVDFESPEMIAKIFQNAIKDIEQGNVLDDLPEFNF